MDPIRELIESNIGSKGSYWFSPTGTQRGSSDSADVFRFSRKVGEESERLVESCLQLGSLFIQGADLVRPRGRRLLLTSGCGASGDPVEGGVGNLIGLNPRSSLDHLR